MLIRSALKVLLALLRDQRWPELLLPPTLDQLHASGQEHGVHKDNYRKCRLSSESDSALCDHNPADDEFMLKKMNFKSISMNF